MRSSGPEWVSKFPPSVAVDDLSEPFRTNVRRFLAALGAAHATAAIASTLRPPERAYLMHFSFAIASEGMDPATVPAMAGVNIDWVHRDGSERPDLAASRAAARHMVDGYGIAFRPALRTRHSEGTAIDMTISWSGALTIAGADGVPVTIVSAPRSGGNTDLQAVGSGYGVLKLVTDPPHWSIDGH